MVTLRWFIGNPSFMSKSEQVIDLSLHHAAASQCSWASGKS